MLTHPTPQVFETLFYIPATLPNLTFSQMLTKQALCFDSFERAQLQKVQGTLMLKLYFLT